MANSPVKNVRVENETMKIGPKCVGRLSKTRIYFSIIDILVQIGLL